MKKIFLGLGLVALSACSSMPAAPVYHEVSGAPFSQRDPAQVGSDKYSLSTDGKKRAELENCGGSAELYRDNDANNGSGAWRFSIKGSRCAEVVINGEKRDLDGKDQDRSLNWTLKNEDARYTFKVQSRSGKNSDEVVLYVRKPVVIRTLKSGQWEPLEVCRGYVDYKVENGQANLKFKSIDLSRCHKFDIIGDEGQAVIYPEKTMTNHSPSFTLPKKVIDLGKNKVTLRVRGAAGEEKFNVFFYGVPAGW